MQRSWFFRKVNSTYFKDGAARIQRPTFFSEHNKHFDTEHSAVELRKHPNEKNRLELTMVGKKYNNKYESR